MIIFGIEICIHKIGKYGIPTRTMAKEAIKAAKQAQQDLRTFAIDLGYTPNYEHKKFIKAAKKKRQ